MLRFGTKRLETTLERLVLWSIRRAALVVAFSAVLTAALGYYTVANFQINTDTDRMIDPELPFRQTYQNFNRAFPQLADSFLMVVDAPTAEAADRAAKRLIARIAQQDELYLNVHAPGVGPFFEQNALLFQSVSELVETTDRMADAEPLLAALTEDPSLRGLADVLVLALDDAIEKRDAPERLDVVLDKMAQTIETQNTAPATAPPGTAMLSPMLSWQELLAGDDADLVDLRRRVILVQPALDFSSLQPAGAALADARRAAEELEAESPGLSVRLTGKMALGAEELQSVSDGIALSGIVSLILVTLVLGYGIRSLRLVGAALLTLVVGLTWTAAFAIFAIGYFNIISVAFAVLFIGLGIDFAIHFVLRYREEVAAGTAIDEALRRTALGVGGPLALCAPTTALAFYAFVPTAYAGLAQLGIISGTGMFISLATSLTLLPALLKLMPLGRADKARAKAHTQEAGPARALPSGGRRAGLIGVGVGVVALAAAPFIHFEFDTIKLKDQKSESVRAYLDLLDTGKSSPYAVQIVAANLDEAARIKAELDDHADVSRVVTLASFVPADQDEKLGILFDASLFMTPVLMGAPLLPPPDASARLAALASLREKLAAVTEANTSPSLAAASARLDTALGAALAAPNDAGRTAGAIERALVGYFPDALSRLRQGFSATGVTLDDVPDDIRQRYQAADGRVRVAVFPEADLGDQAALEAFVLEISAEFPEATGNAVQVVGAGHIVIEAMKQATATAALIIIVFLGFIIGRARDVALIGAPVFLAASLTAAATVLFDMPFNFANVIVLPLLIGLGVDSGIHLVLRAREEGLGANDTGTGDSRAPGDVPSDGGVMETSTPRAVLLSALTTIGSFGSLMLSAHDGTASMGALLTISILLTLGATLIVLPGLIAWVYGRGETGAE